MRVRGMRLEIARLRPKPRAWVLPAYIIPPMTIKDDNTLDDAPPETVALWIRLVRTMDAAMLASFVDRTWRTWSRESLRPLEAAVKARRAELSR
jgi:hypothetical protein